MLAPLAGVMLIILALAVSGYPLRTHALVLDFPEYSPPPQECSLPANPCNMHNLSMATDGSLAWDGQPVSRAGALAALIAADNAPTQRIVLFAPSPDASYDAVLRMLAILRQALGEGSTVFICGMDTARRFELPHPKNPAEVECTGSQFAS